MLKMEMYECDSRSIFRNVVKSMLLRNNKNN